MLTAENGGVYVCPLSKFLNLYTPLKRTFTRPRSSQDSLSLLFVSPYFTKTPNLNTDKKSLIQKTIRLFYLALSCIIFKFGCILLQLAFSFTSCYIVMISTGDTGALCHAYTRVRVACQLHAGDV